jgi:hypothetical protein
MDLQTDGSSILPPSPTRWGDARFGGLVYKLVLNRPFFLKEDYRLESSSRSIVLVRTG